jgi:iron complex outermembrane receptor protein
MSCSPRSPDRTRSPRSGFRTNQYSGNATTLPLYYPLNALTAATYNDVFNRIVAVFPAIRANYGKPIAYRWRNIAGGQREYETDTETLRAALGAEGPLFGRWDYRVGGRTRAAKPHRSWAKVITIAASSRRPPPPLLRAFPARRMAASTPARRPRPGHPRRARRLLNSGILNPFSVGQSEAALAGSRQYPRAASRCTAANTK